VTGLNAPDGLAIRTGGGSILIAETGGGRLLTADLASGSFSPVASQLISPRDVVIEAGDTTALVSDDEFGPGGIQRVDLASGLLTTVVYSSGVDRFALEPTGTVLVSYSGGNQPLVRATLAGGMNVLAVPFFALNASGQQNQLLVDGADMYVYYTTYGSSGPSGSLLRFALP
jgi:hypothetical protein